MKDYARMSLSVLYGHLSKARKRQFHFVLALTFFGAVGELLTLGAVVPFLAIIANPEKAATYPALQLALSVMGWQEPRDFLFLATAIFITLVIFSSCIRLMLMQKANLLAFRAANELGTDAYSRILCQPYSFHIATNTSEIISALTKVDGVVYSILVPVTQIISSAIIASFIIFALLAIDPLVAISAGLGLLTIYLAITFATQRALRINSRIIADGYTERVKTTQEGLGGIRDVIIDQSQQVFVSNFQSVDARLRRAQAVSLSIAAAPRYVIEASGMIMIAALALVLSSNPGGLAEALPVLGALALGTQRLIPLLQMIYGGWCTISSTKESLADVLKLLELPLDRRFQQVASRGAQTFATEVVLDRVSFNYACRSVNVLQDISFRIPKGARIGFVGKTGSGKSTLVDIILGLLAPTSGEVRIDGRPLTAENVRNWQAQIGHVPQKIYLSDATIAENIAFGVPKSAIHQDRLRSAARRAQIDEFISGLPEFIRHRRWRVWSPLVRRTATAYRDRACALQRSERPHFR